MNQEINTEQYWCWVYSFEDFQRWFSELPEQRTLAWSKITTIAERLENSKEKIKDPIAFLHYLYFDQKYSLRKIHNHKIVNKIYSVKGLQRLFVDSFWWDLRKKTDRTPEHNESEQRRLTEVIKEVHWKFSSLLDPMSQYTQFSIRRLRSLEWKMAKVLYILEHLRGIQEINLFRVFSELWYWQKRATSFLNNEIKNTLKQVWSLWWLKYWDLELSHSEVLSWMNANQDNKVS